MSKRYALDFLCAQGEHITDAHTLCPNLDIIVVLTDKMRLVLVSRLILDKVSNLTQKIQTFDTDRLFNEQKLLFN